MRQSVYARAGGFFAAIVNHFCVLVLDIHKRTGIELTVT
jgi:hypothetical protein